MSIMTEGEFRYNMLIKAFPSRPSPGFEDAGEQQAVWGRRWGCTNDVGRLRMVLMHRPGDELKMVDPAKRIEHLGAYGDPETGWYWRGREIPDIATQQAQHDGLVAALREEGVEVVFLDRCAPGKMKSVYTRDQVIAVDGGAIVCRMGAPIRRGEEAPATETLARIGMPILRTIHGTGIMEGDPSPSSRRRSRWWGSRRASTRQARIRWKRCCACRGGTPARASDRLSPAHRRCLRDDRRGHRDHQPGAAPYWFLEKLKELGIRTIEVHPDDPVWTINCLAVAPGRVLMADAVSPTRRRRWTRPGSACASCPTARSIRAAAASTARPRRWCATRSSRTAAGGSTAWPRAGAPCRRTR